jgi:hypothetical protein
MTPDELVGQRIKEARISTMVDAGGVYAGEPDNVRSMYQEELGELLQPYLGKKWSKASVSAAETGRRSLKPVELLAFAAVLGRPVGWFFRPTRDADTVGMPGGEQLNADDLRHVVDGPQPSGPGYVELGGRTVLLHGDERPPIPLGQLLEEFNRRAEQIVALVEKQQQYARAVEEERRAREEEE